MMHLLQRRRGAAAIAAPPRGEILFSSIKASLAWSGWMLGLNIVLNSAILLRLLYR
jgi:hypothetical protein